ncbi:MAG: AAA family ATPase [Deltaproteobacteria bacterium]|nr:AAA family ATPase [Deltaproteobacteria bacterium]
MEGDIRYINEIVRNESAFVDPLVEELGRVVVGQKRMLEGLLIGLLTGGHILLEGVPGLAKTLTVQTLADVIETRFQRIQFTPDLLPADIIGTMVYNQKTGEFTPRQGPIFSNIVLADEINRAPAKVQSALLEAMQEKQVTIGDRTYKLDPLFLVLATQNPIEQEGTYPLPEAQVDRFMLKILVGYPSRDEEQVIMERMTALQRPTARPVIRPEAILKAREVLHQVYVDEKIKRYILDIVFATRTPAEYRLERLKDFIAFGASPRASLFLLEAARAQAFLRHRGYVIPEDVKEVAPDVLRHRVLLTYEAEAEELAPEGVIRQILDEVEVP